MSVDTWTLLIKSINQTIQSVVVPSSASVLQLKDAIRLEFDIANDRQRLIFQGKVLKDGTQLTDYSNLQDGKIIHLVARPADAPTNPVNDQPPSTPRGTTPQMFPGMTEGYTFITLDANISDLGGSTSALSSLFSGLLGGASDRNGAMNGPMNTRTQYTFSLPSQNNTTTRNNNSTSPRPPLTLGDWLNRRQPGEFSSLLDNPAPRASTPSLETRLIRTVAAMTNIRTNLDALPGEADITQFNPSAASNASPEAIQTIRSQLRASGTSEMAQVGFVVNNMSDLMDTMSTRMRQLGQELQTENASHDQLAPRLQHMVTSIQNLNTVNQFVGDIMGSVTSPRQRRSLRSSTRERNQQVNTTGTASRNTRRTQSRNPSSSTSSTITTRSSEPPTSSSSSSSTTASSKRKSRSAKALDSATTSSSKKRKTRSTSTADTDHSSSSTATPSSSKRQKTNKNNSETGKNHTTSTATTKKGKGKRRSLDDDN